MTDWYYEDSGQSRGPVKESELRTMLADGLLPAATRVWHAGFGQDWRSATEAGFNTRAGMTPPPLRQAGSSATPPVLPPAGQAHAAPPASPVAAPYSSTYANLIAAVPLIIMALEFVVLAAGVSPYDRAYQQGGIWWTLILSFFFAYKDAKSVSAAGLNPQGKALVPFMLLTQIGYFLRRRSVTGLPLKPLWLWLGAAAIYIVWTGIVYA